MTGGMIMDQSINEVTDEELLEHAEELKASGVEWIDVNDPNR